VTLVDHIPNPSGFKLLKLKRSAQEQITDYLREEISSGNLKPGAKLASTQDLAAQWQTHANTVHRAMGPLVKEGLLVRMLRAGTFVREREEKLTCVAVYDNYSSATPKQSPFAQAVRQALRDELHQAGIEVVVWADPRPEDQQGEPWQPLVKAAKERRFQAFIAAETNLGLLQWQRQLPVPTAFVGAPISVPNNVDHDMRQFVEISLQELARQGCRSVGCIAPLLDAPDAVNPEGARIVWFAMLEHFIDVAHDLGLTVKNEWMRVFQHHPDGERGQERFGYEQFLEIWNQPEKPEGLLTYTDIAVRGMLLAIREKHVRVPEDLKLVLYKNETIDLFCPMPATFVIASERDVARALIEQVQKQFRGESCERISLPFKLAAHTNP